MAYLRLFEDFDEKPKPLGNKYKNLKQGDVIEITGIATRLSNKNMSGSSIGTGINTKVSIAAVRVLADDGTLFVIKMDAIDALYRSTVDEIFQNTKVVLKGTVGKMITYAPSNQKAFEFSNVEYLELASQIEKPAKDMPANEPKEKTEDEIEYNKLRSRFTSSYAPTLSREDRRAYWDMSPAEKKVYITDYMQHVAKAKEEKNATKIIKQGPDVKAKKERGVLKNKYDGMPQGQAKLIQSLMRSKKMELFTPDERERYLAMGPDDRFEFVRDWLENNLTPRRKMALDEFSQSIRRYNLSYEDKVKYHAGTDIEKFKIARNYATWIKDM